MTTKIKGTPQFHPSGITIDAPAKSFELDATALLRLAEKVHMSLVLADRKVSRRLKCHIVIDPLFSTIRAYETLDECFKVLREEANLTALLIDRTAPSTVAGFTVDLTVQHEFSYDDLNS